ncbi:MAG: PAS domain S-box protein [Sphingomonadales bacterium]|nr:PAS domain S-box protein [Sphingomonadales bacterium]
MTTISADALRAFLENMPDGFFVYDESGRLLDANARFHADTGYSPQDLPTLSIQALLRGRSIEALRGQGAHVSEILLRKDGSSFPAEIALSRSAFDGETLFFGIVRDVGAREAARAASEDPLTGLANRARSDEELVKACLHATRTGEPLTLAMIDVGTAGDGAEALHVAAAALRSMTRRPYDLAALYAERRLLLLLPAVDEPAPMLERIVAEAPVTIGAVVAFELADVAPQDLIAGCEQALERAAQSGAGCIEIVRL